MLGIRYTSERHRHLIGVWPDRGRTNGDITAPFGGLTWVCDVSGKRKDDLITVVRVRCAAFNAGRAADWQQNIERTCGAVDFARGNCRQRRNYVDRKGGGVGALFAARIG